jgi:PAS domain S-box-containing protein
MLSDLVETELESQLRDAQRKITELEKTVHDLRDREYLLQSVLDAIPVRVFWKERNNLSYLGANRLFAQDGGLDDPAALIGKTDHDMVWAAQAELYRADDRAVIESEISKINYEEPQSSASGDIWLRTSKIPLRNSDGDVIGMLGTYDDITPYKRAEADIRASRERLLAVVNNAPIVLYAVDAEGRFTLSQGRGLEDLGLTPGQLVGISVYDVYNGVDDIVEGHRKALAGESVYYVVEVQGRHYQTWLIPEKDTNGTVTGVVGVAIDVTQRAEAEQARDEALKFSELNLQMSQSLAKATTAREVLLAAMDTDIDFGDYSTSISYIDIDANGEPEYTTLAATSTEPDPNAAVPIGMRIDLKVLPFSQIWFSQRDTPILIEDVENDPRVDPNTAAFYRMSNISTTVTIPMYQNGRWVGIMGVYWQKPHTFTEAEIQHYATLPRFITPIVDNLRLIDQLEENLQQLEIANAMALENARLKSEFLATMSHELRTPLNAIEGFTSVILSNMGGVEYNHRTQHYVERVNTNSKRLLSLINDFLDLSRIESGRLQLANSPFAPRQMVEKLQAQLGGLAQAKGLDFTVHVDSALPDTLLGDEEQLSRVLVNLLGNAIKFTEQGSVSLELRQLDDQWHLQVSDTGIGIPPHAREYIFEEFRQVDSSSKRKFGGTGLGLAIVQKLVRAMNGTITVESEVDRGSRFTVTLPLGQ